MPWNTSEKQVEPTRMKTTMAVIRMVEVLGLAADVLARLTGVGRPVIDAFASVSGRVAGLLDALPEATQATLGEPLQHAFLNAPEEFAAPLMSAAAGALGSAARAALREHLDEELASLEAAARPGASGPRRLRLSSALAQLADAEGDPDAFEAAQNRRAPALRDHVGVAERLLAAGRAQEALSALEAAPRGAAQADISFGETRIRILDALKQREAAQAARWNLFSATLSVDVLRGHLRRLPDFDEVEREEEALRLAERHADTSAVLAFLAAWPDLRRAGAQVRARQGRLDHHDVTLPNLAAALADHDPLAATLLLRARISGLIAARRAGGCAAAGRWIGECAALALTIADWEGRPDHSAYIARLRLTYPRKAALWRAVATS